MAETGPKRRFKYLGVPLIHRFMHLTLAAATAGVIALAGATPADASLNFGNYVPPFAASDFSFTNTEQSLTAKGPTTTFQPVVITEKGTAAFRVAWTLVAGGAPCKITTGAYSQIVSTVASGHATASLQFAPVVGSARCSFSLAVSDASSAAMTPVVSKTVSVDVTAVPAPVVTAPGTSSVPASTPAPSLPATPVFLGFTTPATPPAGVSDFSAKVGGLCTIVHPGSGAFPSQVTIASGKVTDRGPVGNPVAPYFSGGGWLSSTDVAAIKAAPSTYQYACALTIVPDLLNSQIGFASNPASFSGGFDATGNPKPGTAALSLTNTAQSNATLSVGAGVFVIRIPYAPDPSARNVQAGNTGVSVSSLCKVTKSGAIIVSATSSDTAEPTSTFVGWTSAQQSATVMTDLYKNASSYAWTCSSTMAQNTSQYQLVTSTVAGTFTPNGTSQTTQSLTWRVGPPPLKL